MHSPFFVFVFFFFLNSHSNPIASSISQLRKMSQEAQVSKTHSSLMAVDVLGCLSKSICDMVWAHAWSVLVGKLVTILNYWIFLEIQDNMKFRGIQNRGSL